MLVAVALLLAPVQPCVAAPLPPALAGWARPRPMVAGASVVQAPTLAVGTAITATLARRPAYAVPVRKPGAGGVFAFDVATAGRYRVAAGAAAWIDVVRGGAAIASAAHAHGPDCSTIHKLVDFDLAPGRYLLQVAGSDTPAIALMIVRLDPAAGNGRR